MLNKKTQAKHFLKGFVNKIIGYSVSHRSDSKAFFSGALEHVHEVLKLKLKKPKAKEKPSK